MTKQIMNVGVYMVSSDILFCSMVQTNVVNGVKTQSVFRPISVIEPASIPGNYTFAVYASVSGLMPDTEHNIKIVVSNTDGKDIGEFNVPVKNDGSSIIEGEAFQPYEIGIDVRNALITKEGDITAVLYVDNDELKRAKLKVCKE